MVDWVMGVVLVVVGLGDWFVVTTKIPHTARRISSYSWRLSGLPLSLGAVVGRVFAPSFGPPEDLLLFAAFGYIGIGLVIGLVHYVFCRFADIPNWFSLIYVPCGILPGMLVWPAGQ